MKTFQVCYEGDLSVELADAVRRLHGEPNFDKSWEIQLEKPRSSAVILRYLKSTTAGDGHLVVSEANPSRNREFLLIRHSVTPEFDYSPLRREIRKLGHVLDLPMESTYLVKTTNRTNAHLLGDALEEFCPFDSLMVTGVSRDFSIWTAGSGMYVEHEGWLVLAARA